jgi:uncharacterized protein YceK
MLAGALALPAGCGTLITHFDDNGNFHRAHSYSGVREMAKAIPVLILWIVTIPLVPFAIADLPLSFIADTILLPYDESSVNGPGLGAHEIHVDPSEARGPAPDDRRALSGRALATTLGRVQGLAVVDSKTLVVVCGEGVLATFDAGSGEPVELPGLAPLEHVTAVAAGPGARGLALADATGAVRGIDLETAPVTSLVRHQFPVTALAVAAKGAVLASIGRDGFALTDVTSRETRWVRREGQAPAVCVAAIEGTDQIVDSDGATVTIASARTGRPVGDLTMPVPGGVRSVAATFFGDELVVVAGLDSGSVALIRLMSDGALGLDSRRRLDLARGEPVTALAFRHAGAGKLVLLAAQGSRIVAVELR